MSKESKYTRREFFRKSKTVAKVLAYGTLVLDMPFLVSACSNQEQVSQPTASTLPRPVSSPARSLSEKPAPESSPVKPLKYQGPIEKLRGLDAIGEEELDQMFKALEATGQAALIKAGKDIKLMRTPTGAQDKMPSWLSKNTFPFTILVANSEISTAVVAPTVMDNSPETAFLINTSSGSYTQPNAVKEIALATKLGFTTEIKDDFLFKALLLVKEHLSHLTFIAMVEEFDAILRTNPGMEITNLDRTLLSPEKRQAAARSLVTLNLSDKNNAIWKIGDVFPMLLLVPILEDLDKNSQLPKSFASFIPLIKARKLVAGSGSELMQNLRQIVNVWTANEFLTLPKGTVSLIATDAIMPYALELDKMVNQS